MHKPIITDDSLVGYWPLDEVSGTTAYDYGSGGNDVTLFSMTRNKITNGKRCIVGDGSTSYGILTQNGDMSSLGSGDLTIGGWIKLSSLPAQSVLFQKRKKSADFDGVILYVIAAGTIFFVLDKGITAVSRTYTPLISVLDRWVHLVGTRSGTTVSLFVDGDMVGTTTAVGNDADVSNTGEPYIGSGFDHTHGWFPGLMSDIFTLNTGLSLEEIKAIYKSTYRR